jgi:microcystin-dependent protein
VAESYLGEIRLFAGNYAPVGWASCDGSLLLISEYEALFSLIGTTWGGDGRQNFALPDLRSRLPVGQGQGSGLTSRTLAQSPGDAAVTLTQAQLPAHTHTFSVASNAGSTPTPTGNVLAAPSVAGVNMYAVVDPTKTTNALASDTVSMSGAIQAQAHSNMMPSLSMGFIISLYGSYPQQS